MSAPVLLIVGTASSVGKSVLVTALGRIFWQQGVRVAPFKGQNMSNNADVTPDGGEIGRAQSEQAAACGVTPTVQMNPVLLKPQGDRTSQVVVLGQPRGTLHSREFVERKVDLWPHVAGALDALREEYELVIAEGAGSPAEPNLRDGDIVNMRVARHAGATTLLVGDIDRGGVFAHLLGTLELLPPADRALVRGLVINRFRGDPTLLTPAIEDLERRTGLPVLGVIPWIDDLDLAEEDAVALERPERAPVRAPADHRFASDAPIDIAVIRLPRIANFDDFDPLRAEAGVRLRYVERAPDLGAPDLVILPGTKATLADLAWLHARGLDAAIRQRHAQGAAVLGICGGYQMLGVSITDPDGVEARAGATERGLGLLPAHTTFTARKATVRVSGTVAAAAGTWRQAQGLPVTGYEIHMGRTVVEGPSAPLLSLDGRPDGAITADGRVWGTYLHGLWHNDALREALLAALRGAPTGTARPTGAPDPEGRSPAAPGRQSSAERRTAAFDRLAQVVSEHLDITRLRAMLEAPGAASGPGVDASDRPGGG